MSKPAALIIFLLSALTLPPIFQVPQTTSTTEGNRQNAFSTQQARSRGEEPFLPFAIWYGGGKARAPMLDPDPEKNREAWRADMQQIRDLGFNSIKCWVDWYTTRWLTWSEAHVLCRLLEHRTNMTVSSATLEWACIALCSSRMSRLISSMTTMSRKTASDRTSSSMFPTRL